MTLRTLIALCAVGLLLEPGQALAQSSTYLSTHDAAYADVDALIGVGLIRDAIVAQRPYSRATITQFVREAQDRMGSASGRAASPRIREALDRLTARFLAPAEEPGITLRETRLDATLARSPGRAIPTSYGSRSLIDAELNPLLQRNQGRRYADGATGGGEAEVDVRLGTAVSGQVRARASSAWSDADGTTTEGMVQRAYLRARAGNAALDVGRDYAVNGQSGLGGTVLSSNARGLDMVRLSSDAPFRLPGFLSGAGLFELSALIGQMGEDRRYPHAKLIVFEGSWRPSQYFEMGGLLLNMQGGEGAPPATFTERLDDIFLWILGGERQRLAISDKVAGWNGRITIPDAGLEVYLDGSTTDVNWSRWETLWDEAAWILGARIRGLGPEGRVDVHLEGHRTGVRPQTHHQFTSGLTLDDRVIGSSLGPMATGWEAGLDWHLPEQQFSFVGAWERYRGDEYRNNGLENTAFRWDLVSDNPDEIRVRLVARWLRRPTASGFYTEVRTGIERVTRFGFTDEGRSNGLLQLRAGWIW